MRFLEGENLVDGIQQLGERAAQRQGLTLDDLKRDMLAKFEREGYPEPYAGPSPFVIEAYCSVWKSTIVSLRRAVRHRHRHAIEQASRRWREGRSHIQIRLVLLRHLRYILQVADLALHAVDALDHHQNLAPRSSRPRPAVRDGLP